MSTPTRGRRRVGETKLPSRAPLRRPTASQHVDPQNNSSPPFSFPVSSSTIFSASSSAISSQTREEGSNKPNGADLDACVLKYEQATAKIRVKLAGKGEITASIRDRGIRV